MEIEVKYKGLIDRAEKIKEQEAKRLTMLYDTFDDPSWKHGDPQIGTMTFTDELPVTIQPEPARDLAAEIDDLKAKIADYDTLKARVEKLEVKVVP